MTDFENIKFRLKNMQGTKKDELLKLREDIDVFVKTATQEQIRWLQRCGYCEALTMLLR